MFQNNFAAFRFLFHSFPFGIIDKPDDHILLVFSEKMKNLPNRQQGFCGKRFSTETTDIDQQKYNFFFLTGNIKYRICTCDIKSIQMIPACSWIRQFFHRLLQRCFMKFFYDIQLCYHLFVQLLHQFLIPCIGTPQQAR